MFSMNLLRFSPITTETHLVAFCVAALVLLLNLFLIPGANLVGSFEIGMAVAFCWYIFKVFDGVTYDGADTPIGTILGLILAISSGAAYFLF
jgi:hypothetical protein